MKPQLKPSRTIHNPVSKDYVTFVKTAYESNNRHTWVEIVLAPGSSVPLHSHFSFDETFTCLEGTLTLQIDQKTYHLQPGEFATAIARSEHRYLNQSPEPCRFKCIISPGSSDVEQALQITYGLARDGLCNPETGQPTSLLAQGYLWQLGDIHAAGKLSILNPLMHWLAERARATGLVAEWQRKYVHIL